MPEDDYHDYYHYNDDHHYDHDDDKVVCDDCHHNVTPTETRPFNAMPRCAVHPGASVC